MLPRISFAIISTISLMIFYPLPVSAQEVRDVELIQEITSEGEIWVGTFPVVPGAECTLTTANNVSVHPGNTLLVVNGSSGTITIPDVEDVAGESLTAAFVAATDVTEVHAFVRLNSEDEFPFTSLDLSITCSPPPPPPPPPPPTTPPPPPPTCVELGTCHPDTGSNNATGLLGLTAAVSGVLGGFLLSRRRVA